MILKDFSGKEVTGKLSTKHPASNYGQAVIVVEDKVYTTFDVIGWQLVKATARERAKLKKAGYQIPEAEE